jgi:glycosyltransferase involved in cell wall biosynthesis
LINVVHVVSAASMYGGHVISSIGISKSLSELNELNISLYLDVEERTMEFYELPNQHFYLNSKSFLQFLVNLYNSFKRDNPNIIHIHGTWSLITFLSCIYGYLCNIPYVIHPHGMLSTWSFSHKYIKKNIAYLLYQKWCLKNSKLIFLSSLSEYNDLCKLRLNLNCVVIEQGVSFLSPNNISKLTLDSLRIRNVLFLSRLHPVKGIYELLEVWKFLNPSNWILNIAGPNEGDTLGKVLAYIKLHNLVNSVRILGPANRQLRSELFEGADLFILPSHSENFGIVILEALSFGVPVITTKNTPWRVLEENDCGWWVDMNVHALQLTLKHAMGLSDIERERMGRRGFDLSRNYDTGLASKKIFIEYSKLLK